MRTTFRAFVAWRKNWGSGKTTVGMAHWETTRLAKAHARRVPIFAKALHVGYGRRNIVCEGNRVNDKMIAGKKLGQTVGVLSNNLSF